MTILEKLIEGLKKGEQEAPSIEMYMGLSFAIEEAQSLLPEEKKMLDAAREDEGVGFARFLYYGTWQTIGDDGEDMLYKSYKSGEEKFASELYKIYKNDKANNT